MVDRRGLIRSMIPPGLGDEARGVAGGLRRVCFPFGVGRLSGLGLRGVLKILVVGEVGEAELAGEGDRAESPLDSADVDGVISEVI